MVARIISRSSCAGFETIGFSFASHSIHLLIRSPLQFMVESVKVYYWMVNERVCAIEFAMNE